MQVLWFNQLNSCEDESLSKTNISIEMKKTVPDRSRTFAIFGQIIDEIFQSNAKNDVTKTISCLNWTKQGASNIFTFSFVWFKSWPLVASASLFDTPSSIYQCTFTAPIEGHGSPLVCFVLFVLFLLCKYWGLFWWQANIIPGLYVLVWSVLKFNYLTYLVFNLAYFLEEAPDLEGKKDDPWDDEL
jgi:hypothetical protein